MRRVATSISICILLVAAGIVFFGGDTGTDQPIVITDFGGGINASTSDMKIRPDQFTEVYNMDLGTYVGDAKKRNGYVAITDTVDGNDDALLGIYGLAKQNGKQYLIEVFNDSLDDWANVYISHGDNGRTKENAYLARNGQYLYSTWKDFAFICDGMNYPFVTDGESAYSLHLPAPGEMMVEVLNTDSSRSTLDGTYRWAYFIYPNCDTTTAPCSGWSIGGYWNRCATRHISYITPPITVHKKQVALHLFLEQVKDSACSTPLPLKITIARTKADRVDLDVPFDSEWPSNDNSYDSLWMLNYNITILDDSLETYIFVDSGTDSTAGYNLLTNPFNLTHEFYAYQARGHAFDSCRHPGSPRFYNSIQNDDSSTYTAAHRYGLYDGNGNNGYLQYTISFYDTLLGIESDTGRNVQIYFDSTDSIIDISLPDKPSYLDHCLLYLYRGIRDDGQDTISSLRFIKSFNRDGAIFRDTFSMAVIDSNPDLHPEYSYDGGHFRFAGVVSWDDRLYGWGDISDPNRLYYSLLDTINFPALNSIALNIDDGDKITMAVADRNRLLAYKGNSRHEIYEDADGNFSKSSPPYVSRGTGCIAPKSMCSWRGSRIYLSKYGVVLESGSRYLDKGNTIDTISQGIYSFLEKYSHEELVKAVGYIYNDDQYFLSFAEKDTTFVCFLNVPNRPWAIYSLGIKDAALYEADEDYDFTLPDRLVFCKNESDQLFLWDTTTTDNGQGIVGSLKSGLYSALYNYRISEAWTTINHADNNDSIVIVFYDSEGDSLHQKFIKLNKRFKRNSIGINDPQIGYQWEIIAGADVDSVVIEAIVLYRKFAGLPGLE